MLFRPLNGAADLYTQSRWRRRYQLCVVIQRLLSVAERRC